MKMIMTTMLIMLGIATFSQETVIINGKEWMKDNLNVGTMIPSNVQQTNNGIIEKWCQGNHEATCALYGGYYQWDELMNYLKTEGTRGICPDGFHIPTFEEMSELHAFVGGDSLCGTKLNQNSSAYWMFQKPWRPTNETGFSMRGNGYIRNGGIGMNLKRQSALWTSSLERAYDLNHTAYAYAINDQTKYNVIYSTNNNFPYGGFISTTPKHGYGVRCIKD